jgi:hypothetical protein
VRRKALTTSVPRYKKDIKKVARELVEGEFTYVAQRVVLQCSPGHWYGIILDLKRSGQI